MGQRGPADERPVLAQREIEHALTRRQLLARDEADDPPLGIEPDLGDGALAGLRADDGDRTIARAGDVAYVVAHAERLPLRKQVGAGAAQRNQELRGVTRAGRRRLERLAVGGAHPDPITDGETYFRPPVDGLLDALAPRQLHEDALLAARLRVAAGGVEERQGLVDDEVADI